MASEPEVQREMDVRIDRLERELCALKQRRNTLSPISRLPPEVFCNIFLSGIPDLNYQEDRGRGQPQGIKLSHVSHSWRAIAMGCPELWATFNVGVGTRAQSLKLSFSKSRNAPITLNVCGYSSKGGRGRLVSDAAVSALARIIRDGSTRCQALELYMHEHSLQELLDEFVGSFDRLVSLRLDIVPPVIGNIYAGLIKLRPCSFPQLRHLEVGEALISFGSSLLHSPYLTHVSLGRVQMTSDCISDLLVFLKRSTGLQYLNVNNIHYIGVGSLERDPEGGDGINLGSLKSLAISMGHNTPSSILSSLMMSVHIPVTTRLDLDCSLLVSIKDLMSSIKSAYRVVAPAALNIGSATLRAWSDDSSELEERLRRPRDDGSWIKVYHSDISQSWAIWEWGWSFAQLRALEIAVDGLSGDFWTHLAQNSTHLKTLQIRTSSVSGIAVDQLMALLHGRKQSDEFAMAPAWPALRKLCSPLPSTSHQYERIWEDDIGGPALHYHVEYARDLVAALKARGGVGLQFGVQPLAVLEFATLFDPFVEDDAARILTGAAETVIWQIRSS